jgi:hypothetical protein
VGSLPWECLSATSPAPVTAGNHYHRNGYFPSSIETTIPSFWYSAKHVTIYILVLVIKGKAMPVTGCGGP